MCQPAQESLAIAKKEKKKQDSLWDEYSGLSRKGSFRSSRCNEDPPARHLPRSRPHLGPQRRNAAPSPLTQALPAEAAFSQHGVIRRKISSCQVGANQNSTNRPWHSTTPGVPAALGGEYRLVMNVAGRGRSPGGPRVLRPGSDLQRTPCTVGCLREIRAAKQRLAVQPSCRRSVALHGPETTTTRPILRSQQLWISRAREVSIRIGMELSSHSHESLKGLFCKNTARKKKKGFSLIRLSPASDYF